MVENEQSALLVSPRDFKAMAAAIERILDDAALAQRLTSKTEQLVRTRYSPETYMNSMVGVYRDLAAAND